MQDFLESFTNFYGILGWIAVCFYIFSFQIRNPKNTILCWVPADALMAVHYYGLGSLTSCAMALGAIIRNLTTVYGPKKLIVFIVVIYLFYLWISAYFLSLFLFDFMIATGATFTTLSMLARDYFWRHRLIMLVSNLCFLTGFFLMGSYPGMVNVIFVISSNLIGAARKYHYDFKNK